MNYYILVKWIMTESILWLMTFNISERLLLYYNQIVKIDILLHLIKSIKRNLFTKAFYNTTKWYLIFVLTFLGQRWTSRKFRWINWARCDVIKLTNNWVIIRNVDRSYVICGLIREHEKYYEYEVWAYASMLRLCVVL